MKMFTTEARRSKSFISIIVSPVTEKIALKQLGKLVNGMQHQNIFLNNHFCV